MELVLITACATGEGCGEAAQTYYLQSDRLKFTAAFLAEEYPRLSANAAVLYKIGTRTYEHRLSTHFYLVHKDYTGIQFRYYF